MKVHYSPAFIASLILLFLCLGPTMSCLTRLEHSLGLVGKPGRLQQIGSLIRIDGVDDNLSGVTFNPLTQTLFTVINSPPAIIELSTTGQVLRRIELRGFSDTEDIAHINSTLFAVVEERRGMIHLIHIDAATREIPASDSEVIDLGTRHEDNKGYESLCFQASTETLLTMLERPPFIIHRISLDASPTSERTSGPSLDLRLDDVAAMAVDPAGQLCILSEKSQTLLQLGGPESARYPIPRQAAGSSFQPEGLAFGPDGRIFVVGEPNILAVYKPKSP